MLHLIFNINYSTKYKKYIDSQIDVLYFFYHYKIIIKNKMGNLFEIKAIII